MLLTEVQIQNIFHLGEELVKVRQRLVNFRDIIYSYKMKPAIERMTIFDYNYLYSAYADDTIFFLKNIISVKHMIDAFLSYF